MAGYGPSNLSKIMLWALRVGPLFWADMEGPGCCMEPIVPLGLASRILGPFLYPHKLPPSPCVRIAWARAVILPAPVATSTCLLGNGLVKA